MTSISLILALWTLVSLLYVFATPGITHYWKAFHIAMVPVFFVLWLPTLVLCVVVGMTYDAVTGHFRKQA